MTIEETVSALEEAFGSFREEDAVSWIDIRAAERRLGVDLPHALQQLYTRTGRHRFNTACDTIVPPSELRLDDGWLVFYEESEQTSAWAIHDFGERDPAVYGRVYSDERGLEFVAEFASVSEFLGFEAAFQGAACGALPISGIIKNPERSALATPEGRERISRALASVMRPLASARGDETRYTKGALCFISDSYFALGARDESTFQSIADAIGVKAISEWSYYSPRDD